jgi:hypothetical protein
LKEKESEKYWRGSFIDATTYFSSDEHVKEFISTNGKWLENSQNKLEAELKLPMVSIRLRCGDILQKQASFAVVKLNCRLRDNIIQCHSYITYSVGTMVTNSGGFVPLLYNYMPRKYVVEPLSIPKEMIVKVSCIKNPVPSEATETQQVEKRIEFGESFEIHPYEEVVFQSVANRPCTAYVLIKAI